MFTTVVSTLVAFMVTIGVVKDVAVPAGAYAYDTGIKLYQEYVEK